MCRWSRDHATVLPGAWQFTGGSADLGRSRSPWSGLGLFRLQDWVDGGLNPLFQRYKKHDLSLSTK